MEEMMRTLAGAEQKSTGGGGEGAGGSATDEEEDARKFKELWEKLITEDLEPDPIPLLPPPAVAVGGGQPPTSKQQDPPGSKKSGSNNSNDTTEDTYQRTIQEVMDKLRTSNSELQVNTPPRFLFSVHHISAFTDFPLKQSGSNNPPSSEKTLEELFSSLGDLNLEDGEGENLESVLEGMMSQLMSKEILYEPLKELHDKVKFFLPPPRVRIYGPL